MKRKKKSGKSPGMLLGLVGLGVASGIFGAFFVGPRLSEWTDEEPTRQTASARVPSRAAKADEPARDEAPEEQPRVAIHSARAERPAEPERKSERDSHPPISDRELAELTYDPDADPSTRDSAEEPVRVAVRRGEGEPDRGESEERERRREEERRAEERRREEERREEERREAREREAREREARERAERERTARQPATPAPKPAPAKPAPAKPAAPVTAAGTEAAPAADAGPLLRVRLGRFKSREDAEKLRQELGETPGAVPAVVKVGEDYRIQVGAFRQRENVDKLLQELRARNYRPEVVQDR
ncbi:MAG: SPOR domain-containing protein [Armatimonadota bacterium]